MMLLSIIIAGESYSQVPERFSKPHEEIAEMNWKGNNTFSDYKPEFTSSVFINYNISRDSFPQNETSVKISTKDPNRVVAAWRDFRKGVSPANRRVGYSFSTDGGDTWSVSRLLDSTLIPGFFKNSDPVVAVDSAGNFYIAVICVNVNLGLAVYKSTDGGETFPTAVLAANDGTEDKEWIKSDLVPGSPYYNNLYISWTRFSGNSGIKLIRSTNAGLNWNNAVAVADPSSPGQGSNLAVGLDGEIYVTWVGGTATEDFIYFDKSTNGGLSFGTDVVIQQGSTPNITITSSGVTFPSIETDVSGGLNNGNIYLVWCDARNGDPDIFFSRSTNRGANWSSPLRVNNDPVGNNKLQCWPWIAVNESGKIAVIYYDSRNTSSNNIIEAWLAVSTDGGLTFSNSVLSSVPTPTSQPNSDVRFGDYIGIDFRGDRIVPVWTDERAGGFNMEIYTAIVSKPVNISGLNTLLPSDFDLSQNYPNPFNPVTKIKYSIPQQGYVTLKVFNSLGKEVSSLVEEVQNPGNYEVKWDGSVSNSGIYFYKLQVNDFVQTKKMILLK